MTLVAAPADGRVIAISEVPDPVFSGQLVGPGVGIVPHDDATTIVSPVAGTIVKLHPHAVALQDASGLGVLVHLGIDTVKLKGEGFTLLAAEGDTVDAGTPLVKWDPVQVSARGLSNVVVVVALDRPADSISDARPGTEVAAGSPLFSA